MRLAVLVSTYRQPAMLDATLASLGRQRRPADEILVADDGSDDPTRAVVDAHRAAGLPVLHLWQADLGFRLAQARNMALHFARADYLVQLDGDMACPPHFLADHLRWARPRRFIMGTRVTLGEGASRRMREGGRIPGALATLFRSEDNFHRRYRNLRLPWLTPLLSQSSRRGRRPTKAFGANMSFWLDDLRAVNGYDARYRRHGGEDVDIANRLMDHGCEGFAMFFTGAPRHLWHPSRFNPQPLLPSEGVRPSQGLDRLAALGLDVEALRAAGFAGARIEVPENPA